MINLDFLEEIAKTDIEQLKEKDEAYGSSWKKRGGAGAFHQGLARKWDRIEIQAEKHEYDIFLAIEKDSRTESILDDIGDLRRYLMLVESEIIFRKAKKRNALGDLYRTSTPETIHSGVSLEETRKENDGRQSK